MIWLGLIVGTGLWAASTQFGQILPYVDCGSHFHWSAAAALAAMAVTLLGGCLSWRASARGPTALFASRLSALAALVFAFALLLQTGAGFMLTGCER